MSARAFLAVAVAGQSCVLALDSVREIVAPPALTPVPRAPLAVSGLFNLRGRIATAIDLRRRLGLEGDAKGPSVIVEEAGELYGLAIDSVAGIVSAPADAVSPCPPALAPPWAGFAAGLVRADDGVAVLLDCAALTDFRRLAA